MPLLWKYLLRRYLSVSFSLAFGTSAGLLLLRLDDIAHIASLGAEAKDVFLFSLYQIPYLFPIVLPVAALLASYILFKELRDTEQLTSLRSGGIGINRIIYPLAIASFILSLLNGYLLSEVSTAAHYKSHLLKKRLRTINPLQLLHNKKIIRLHGAFFETLGSFHVGHFAKKAIIALPHETGMRLFFVENLSYEDDRLKAKDASLLFSGSKGRFHAVENARELFLDTDNFASFFKEKAWTVQGDHLGFQELVQKIKSAPSQKKQSQHISELIRRVCLAFLVFCFTMLGAACCLTLGRKTSYKGLILLVANVAYFLFIYFLGDALVDKWPLYLSLFLSSYLLMGISSYFCFKRYEKGHVW